MSWTPLGGNRQLLWEYGRGLAAWGGVTVAMTVAPRIDGIANMSEIRYVGKRPSKCRIRLVGEPTRPMTDHEIELVEALLTRMCVAARDALTT